MSKFITNNGSVINLDVKFLLVVNADEKELYILHRDFPRCLIYVEQTTPLNFVVLDFFETDENKEKSIEILTSESFKSELKDFVSKSAFSNNMN